MHVRAAANQPLASARNRSATTRWPPGNAFTEAAQCNSTAGCVPSHSMRLGHSAPSKTETQCQQIRVDTSDSASAARYSRRSNLWRQRHHRHAGGRLPGGQQLILPRTGLPRSITVVAIAPSLLGVAAGVSILPRSPDWHRQWPCRVDFGWRTCDSRRYINAWTAIY